MYLRTTGGRSLLRAVISADVIGPTSDLCVSPETTECGEEIHPFVIRLLRVGKKPIQVDDYIVPTLTWHVQ